MQKNFADTNFVCIFAYRKQQTTNRNIMENTETRYAMTYTINNGTSYSEKASYYRSFEKALADGKEIVRGNHFPQEGNRSYVTVIDVLTGKTVYEGLLWGRRKRFINFAEED